jgi:hypothetical protein
MRFSEFSCCLCSREHYANGPAQAYIYLVKDAILLAVYLGFILDGRRYESELRGVGLIKIVLIISFLFGSIEVLNPNSPSILVGLIGLKAIIIGSILPKDPPEVRLPEHDHVVETFPSDRADESLRVRILPRRARAMGLSRMPMARNRRVTAAP